MNKLIFLFSALFILESLYCQNIVKSITKVKSGKVFCIEQYDSIGSLIFKKEMNNLFQKKEPTSIQRHTNIHAVKKDIAGNVEYDFLVHSKLGYLIKKFNYIEGKLVTTYIIDEGYYTNREINDDDFAFLFDLSNYTDFINHPITNELVEKRPYLYNEKHYYQGRNIYDIDFNSNGDTTEIIYYSYTPHSIKTTYRRNNVCIEHVNEFDSTGRIISEIRIDSNSHYLIKGQDTSQVVINRYSNSGLLFEKINYKSIDRSVNNWYKIVYTYDTDNHVIKEIVTNYIDQPLSTTSYTYKNGLIINERNIRYTIFEDRIQKKKESIQYNYEFY